MKILIVDDQRSARRVLRHVDQHAEAVAAAALGLVQVGVGPLDQILGAPRIGVIDLGHAQADRRRDGQRLVHERRVRDAGLRAELLRLRWHDRERMRERDALRVHAG